MANLKAFFMEGNIEAGVDEAGRGCLAGPVVAAAVILPPSFELVILDDSKKMSAKQRVIAKEFILNESLTWGVAFVDNLEIDKINILNASILAMHRALDKLKIVPDSILVDGNKFKPFNGIPHHCIVKGDSKYASIAAASVLAKTFRDDYMLKLDKEFSDYDWKNNKGYPTLAHRESILNFGITPFHRKSFRLLPDPVQTKLF